MKITALSLLTASSFFIAGCVSNPPITVPDAANKEYISAIGITCKKPFVTPVDCSGFSGPTKKITISEVEVKVAGSEDGKTIRMFGGKSHGNQMETSNLAYELIKREFNSNSVQIVSVTPIVSGNLLFGYLFETDKEAYSLLDKYAE